MHKLLLVSVWLFFQHCCMPLFAQTIPENSRTVQKQSPDTGTLKSKKIFNPATATKRSAMVPGWGQIYNKKYWKLPLVYGALGTTTGIFFFNLKTYKLLRLAYLYKTDTNTANLALIDPRFKNLSASSLKVYRNSYRQNVDYSVLFFILFWGLNVVDATVDAQLKAFDVNDNLSLKLAPGFSNMANTTGLSLVFDIHAKSSKATK